jgi:hypothetical protein
MASSCVADRTASQGHWQPSRRRPHQRQSQHRWQGRCTAACAARGQGSGHHFAEARLRGEACRQPPEISATAPHNHGGRSCVTIYMISTTEGVSYMHTAGCTGHGGSRIPRAHRADTPAVWGLQQHQQAPAAIVPRRRRTVVPPHWRADQQVQSLAACEAVGAGHLQLARWR